MPTIIARGQPEMVDITGEFSGRTTLTFGMWCTTDEGKSYVHYVDVTPQGHNYNIAGNYRVWPQDVQDTLDRVQADFEKDPSAYGQEVPSPQEAIDQRKKDSVGMEEADHDQMVKAIHEQAQQISDWAADPSGQRKEREHDLSGAPCWCGKRGVHEVGTDR